MKKNRWDWDEDYEKQVEKARKKLVRTLNKMAKELPEGYKGKLRSLEEPGNPESYYHYF